MTAAISIGSPTREALRDDTLLIHAGRDPRHQQGAVNPPIMRASTIIFDTMEAYDRRKELFYDGVSYGLYGTSTAHALSAAIAELEGGSRTVLTGSGTAAIALALTAILQRGDHVLVADSAYQNTRTFCDTTLAKFGVETSYYDPTIGAGVEALIRPNTRAIYMESPGSLTFEVQDVPAIASIARRRGIVTLIDNSWASPLYCKPLQLGVDVSIQPATKYLSGHSDVLLGAVTTRDEALFKAIKDIAGRFGSNAAPDDCYLVLRGMRSLAVRMERHQANGLALARWLEGRPEVARVLHPSLPDDPGHEIWRRDFKGASGLFGVLLRSDSRDAIACMIERCRLFKIGSSWGGFESLIVPGYPQKARTARPWTERGFLLRFHAGLEDAGDLIIDLERAFAALRGV
ncbi:cystathionine beta-lyase [Terrarubrum flagellatum]|uniref:cystathionine beta-lyase n=1 Tax=Terrirubrum flagellatum TaxID=2895980 RepID=UPI0031456D6C